jgi:CTP:molybdopterin cytidylyltransferase MocA
VVQRVAGVLLAAGEGSRLGQPKALVRLGGLTLAERGVATLRDGGADPVLVVTGEAPVLLDDAHTVYNPDWRTGMGSSVRAALRFLADAAGPQTVTLVPSRPFGGGVGAVVIALADQPLVGAGAVRRLIGSFGQGASLAVASYGGKGRNPVLIAREHWAGVEAAAVGDAGARAFIRAHPELVTLVECGDTGAPDDIDTPEDLARVAALFTRRP